MARVSGSSCSGFSLLCLTSSLMSLLFHVSSASSQSAYRFTLGLAAGGQSHTPLARLHTFTPSPTHLPTYLPTWPPPPALCCPHKKRLREAEDNGPSMCPSCRCPALREALSRPFFIPLSCSVPSPSALGVSWENPLKGGFFCTCVSDQRAEGGGRFLGLVFGASDSPLSFCSSLPPFLPSPPSRVPEETA